MKAQDPTQIHGSLFFLISLLLVTLLMVTSFAGPVQAKKDMQVATEGDPGDGNLSPESLQAASGSSPGSTMDGGMKSYTLQPLGIEQKCWFVSLPGVPGQMTWFFLSGTAGDLFRWSGIPVSLQWERRCGHAR